MVDLFSIFVTNLYLLIRAATLPSLDPPEDPHVTTLYVGGLDETITEEVRNHKIKLPTDLELQILTNIVVLSNVFMRISPKIEKFVKIYVLQGDWWSNT